MRVVLDTTTLASGAIAPAGGTLATIIDAWQDGRLTVVVSPAILEVLTRTLANSYFTRRLGPELVQSYLELARQTAILVRPTGPIPRVATHSEDDLILATACSVQPVVLISSDRQLQHLRRYPEVTILSPRAFLDLFLAGE